MVEKNHGRWHAGLRSRPGPRSSGSESAEWSVDCGKPPRAPVRGSISDALGRLIGALTIPAIVETKTSRNPGIQMASGSPYAPLSRDLITNNMLLINPTYRWILVLRDGRNGTQSHDQGNWPMLIALVRSISASTMFAGSCRRRMPMRRRTGHLAREVWSGPI